MKARFRLLLPLGYGALIASAFLASWAALGRTATLATLAGAANIGVAAALAAALALAAERILRRWPWSARFAAVVLILLVGTAGILAVLMGFPAGWRAHPIIGLAPHHALYVLANFTVSALYSFLTIPAWLLLPLGLPLTIFCAALITRRRIASGPGSAMPPRFQEPR